MTMAPAMENRMRKLGPLQFIALVAAASCALTAPASRAQDSFPPRLVKIVVPAAPGSTTDSLARIVADQLGRKWARSVIVENIAGGAMNIGAASVAHAPPDGSTLMVAPPAPLSFNDLLYRDLGYVPTQFVPLTRAPCRRYRPSRRRDCPDSVRSPGSAWWHRRTRRPRSRSGSTGMWWRFSRARR